MVLFMVCSPPPHVNSSIHSFIHRSNPVPVLHFQPYPSVKKEKIIYIAREIEDKHLPSEDQDET